MQLLGVGYIAKRAYIESVGISRDVLAKLESGTWVFDNYITTDGKGASVKMIRLDPDPEPNQPPAAIPGGLLVDIQANAHAVAGAAAAAEAAPQAAPQLVAQAAPQAAPQLVAQAAPQAAPQLVAQAAPQAAPQLVAQAAPQAAPQLVAQAAAARATRQGVAAPVGPGAAIYGIVYAAAEAAAQAVVCSIAQVDIQAGAEHVRQAITQVVLQAVAGASDGAAEYLRLGIGRRGRERRRNEPFTALARLATTAAANAVARTIAWTVSRAIDQAGAHVDLQVVANDISHVAAGFATYAAIREVVQAGPQVDPEAINNAALQVTDDLVTHAGPQAAAQTGPGVVAQLIAQAGPQAAAAQGQGPQQEAQAGPQLVAFQAIAEAVPQAAAEAAAEADAFAVAEAAVQAAPQLVAQMAFQAAVHAASQAAAQAAPQANGGAHAKPGNSGRKGRARRRDARAGEDLAAAVAAAGLLGFPVPQPADRQHVDHGARKRKPRSEEAAQLAKQRYEKYGRTKKQRRKEGRWNRAKEKAAVAEQAFQQHHGSAVQAIEQLEHELNALAPSNAVTQLLANLQRNLARLTGAAQAAGGVSDVLDDALSDPTQPASPRTVRGAATKLNVAASSANAAAARLRNVAARFASIKVHAAIAQARTDHEGQADLVAAIGVAQGAAAHQAGPTVNSVFAACHRLQAAALLLSEAAKATFLVCKKGKRRRHRAKAGRPQQPVQQQPVAVLEERRVERRGRRRVARLRVKQARRLLAGLRRLALLWYEQLMAALAAPGANVAYIQHQLAIFTFRLGVDPGVHDLATAAYRQGRPIRSWSTASFRHRACYRDHKRWEEKTLRRKKSRGRKQHGLERWQSRIPTGDTELTAGGDGPTLLERFDYLSRALNAILDHYHNLPYRTHRWHQFSDRQRAMHRQCAEMMAGAAPFQVAVCGFGNAAVNAGAIRGAKGPVKELRTKLAGHGEVIGINEFRTSLYCSDCVRANVQNLGPMAEFNGTYRSKKCPHCRKARPRAVASLSRSASKGDPSLALDSGLEPGCQRGTQHADPAGV